MFFLRRLMFIARSAVPADFYAVAAIESGDDIKTVQGNLGHATAAFTLNLYAHTTQKMRQRSAGRMERFVQSVSGAK